MNRTLEQAMEDYEDGIDIILDGDNHKIFYGLECCCCHEYFYSDKITLYCKRC